MFGVDSYHIPYVSLVRLVSTSRTLTFTTSADRVKKPAWPYLTLEDWQRRIKPEGHEEDDSSQLRGRWGRVLHVFSFGGTPLPRSCGVHHAHRFYVAPDQVMVGNEWNMSDEEGRALLSHSFPSFATALQFDRYHHVFQIFYPHHSPASADAPPSVKPTPVVLLVALRSAFSYEIISHEEMTAYAGKMGCPHHIWDH